MGVFQSLLNRVFTVSRLYRVPDGQGGWTAVWSDAGPVQGRMRPASGSERTVADSEERQISHVLYVAAGADLERGDLVTCEDGLTVEVLGVREPSRAREHWEVDCLERQEEQQELGS